MTTNYHTPININAPGNSSTVNSPLGQLDSALTDVVNGLDEQISNTVFTKFLFDNTTSNQISSGTINIVDELFVSLVSETSTSDDLDNIITSTDAQLLILKPASGHNITITDAGNISNTPINLDDTQVALLVYDNSQWSIVGSTPSVDTFTPMIAILRDEKAANTAGGSSSATTWNARDLNTEVSDNNGIVSISSNQFTPISGTFKIHASAPAFKANNHRLRLYNVTGAASVDEGPVAHNAAADAVTTTAFLNTIFTANGTSAYRIDHYTVAAQATNGLGAAVNDGSNEIYLEIVLEKLS